MANIDNHMMFRKKRDADHHNTLFMVYRAERLYSAKGDAEKIFGHVCRLILEKEKFSGVYNK